MYGNIKHKRKWQAPTKSLNYLCEIIKIIPLEIMKQETSFCNDLFSHIKSQTKIAKRQFLLW